MRCLLLAFALSAPCLAQTQCPPPSTVQVYAGRTSLKGASVVWEHDLEGTAIKDEGPLKHADIRLYTGKKLVRHVTADENGHFVLKNLSLGHYQLSLKGLGAFEIELLPPHLPEQEYYTFTSYHGCLSVSFSADSN